MQEYHVAAERLPECFGEVVIRLVDADGMWLEGSRLCLPTWMEELRLEIEKILPTITFRYGKVWSERGLPG